MTDPRNPIPIYHICVVCRRRRPHCLQNLTGRFICQECLERAGQLTLGGYHPLDTVPKPRPRRPGPPPGIVPRARKRSTKRP